MTITLFLAILTITSSVSSLITEAIKKMLDPMDVKYSSPAIISIVAVVVGVLGTLVYYFVNRMPVDGISILFVALETLATWLVSQLGYDKVKELILSMRAMP